MRVINIKPQQQGLDNGFVLVDNTCRRLISDEIVQQIKFFALKEIAKLRRLYNSREQHALVNSTSETGETISKDNIYLMRGNYLLVVWLVLVNDVDVVAQHCV